MGLFRKIGQKLNSQSVRDLLRELGWVLRYARQFRKEMLLHVLLSALGTALSLAASVLSKHIIDTVTGFESSALVPILVFYVSMQLLTILLNAITGRINAKLGIRVGQQIRREVFDKMMRIRWESLSSFHSADIETVVSDIVVEFLGVELVGTVDK